jgi:DNA-binding transcriptional ArsR family regulator
MRNPLGVTMQDALDAISHPGRRAMLRLVLDRELPVNELAEHLGLSQPAASQHLKILRDAGLVRGRVGSTGWTSRDWSGCVRSLMPTGVRRSKTSRTLRSQGIRYEAGLP